MGPSEFEAWEAFNSGQSKLFTYFEVKCRAEELHRWAKERMEHPDDYQNGYLHGLKEIMDLMDKLYDECRLKTEEKAKALGTLLGQIERGEIVDE